jgi:hypothetical protein
MQHARRGSSSRLPSCARISATHLPSNCSATRCRLMTHTVDRDAVRLLRRCWAQARCLPFAQEAPLAHVPGGATHECCQAQGRQRPHQVRRKCRRPVAAAPRAKGFVQKAMPRRYTRPQRPSAASSLAGPGRRRGSCKPPASSSRLEMSTRSAPMP